VITRRVRHRAAAATRFAGLGMKVCIADIGAERR
jgi:hypothetical protein